MNEKYDYLLVGAGLYNGVVAWHAAKAGKRCLVVEKRAHAGGNVYCEDTEGIHVHKYGAHIFHTSDRRVWDFVNSLCEFNRYTNSPIANYRGEIYNLPFNMNTFNRLWGVVTPDEAREKIASQRGEISGEPKNLEEQAISLVGRDIYEKLVKGYTEKQWGRDCRELPAFIIRRLPVRFTYDNNYFNDRYQGIPEGGYNVLTDRLFEGAEMKLSCDYLEHREELDRLCAGKIIYTGPIDSFFGGRLGELEYRSLRFETETLDKPDFQGNAVVNYTDRETPWTRIIEHKHFEFGTQGRTVITREYPVDYEPGMEPYYPVNDERNQKLYESYRKLAEEYNRGRGENPEVLFGGRLGEYRYYDMDKVIASALSFCDREFS